MLQARRSSIRIPIRWIFFNLPNRSSRTMAPGVDSASNRNEHQESPWGIGGRERLACKAVNPTAICVSIIYSRCGDLSVSQPYKPPRHITGIALPSFSSLFLMFRSADVLCHHVTFCSIVKAKCIITAPLWSTEVLVGQRPTSEISTLHGYKYSAISFAAFLLVKE
jgi:hypothetical protein